MNVVQKIDHWREEHHTVWMDVLRMALGLILLLKGIQFAGDPKEVKAIISGSPFDPWSMMLIHYIVMIHIAGGIMIMIGLLTRLAILFQVPILCGAVVFVGRADLFSFYSGEAMAVVVLVLLLFFLFYGSGTLSADGFMKRHPDT